MNAEEYFERIPDRHENAMPRPYNPATDRRLRDMIAKANQNGEDIYIGNEKLLALSGISVPSLPENKEVGTDVYVAKGKTLLGASPFPMPSSPTPSKASKT